MIENFFKFVDDAVALGKIKPDYEIHALKDLTGSSGPGTLFIELMKSWEGYSKTMNCKKALRAG